MNRSLCIRNLFFFILGCICFSGIGAYASTIINGRDVAFESSDSITSNNVQDAIEELYSKYVDSNQSLTIKRLNFRESNGTVWKPSSNVSNSTKVFSSDELPLASKVIAAGVIVYKNSSGTTLHSSTYSLQPLIMGEDSQFLESSSAVYNRFTLKGVLVNNEDNTITITYACNDVSSSTGDNTFYEPYIYYID